MSHIAVSPGARSPSAANALMQVAALFTGVAAAAFAAIELAWLWDGAPVFRPADGIMLAVLVVAPARYLPAYAAIGLAAQAAGCWAADGLHDGLAMSIGIGAVVSLLGAGAVRRFIADAFGPTGLPDLSSSRAFLRFLLAGCLLPAAIAGCLAAGLLPSAGSAERLKIFALWFQAEALGIMVFGPALLCLMGGELGRQVGRHGWTFPAALLCGTGAVAAIVFTQTRYPLLFLIPPLLLALAGRLGCGGISLFGPVLAAIALVGTALGHGPFAIGPMTSPAERLTLAQLFIWANMLLGRFAGALVAAKLQAQSEAERAAEARQTTLLSLQTLIDAVPDYLWIKDLHGRFVIANRALAHDSGHASAAAILGLTDFDLHPTERAREFQASEQQVIASGEAMVNQQELVVDASGRTHALLSNKVPLRDLQGRMIGLAGIARDITDRVAAQAALAEREEQMRLLLEAVVDHAVYMLDADGRVVSWNAAAGRIKGYAADEIIGRPYEVFFTDEDRAADAPRRTLAHVIQQGPLEMEAWRQRKDGSRFWARVSVAAIRGPGGELRGFAKVVQDLTARNFSEVQRAIIIEAAPNGMLIVDESGIITLANMQAEEIFGYGGGELIGKPLETLVPEELRYDHTLWRAAFMRGEHADMTLVRAFDGRRRDGSMIALEVMLRPVRTPHGGVIVASVFDTTERLRLQAEQAAQDAEERRKAAEQNERLEQLSRNLAHARDRAEEASVAKTRFLTGISHELRTPLNGVLGYAQLLRAEGGLTTAQAARVQSMLGAGQHLLGMINSVLDLSQIESDNMQMQAETIDLQALAKMCLDVVRPAIEAKGLSLDLAAAPDAPLRIVADPVRLRQILVNLLGNAGKFTPVGGVTMRVLKRPAGPGVRLEVADTGPGISAANQSRLFREFDRLHAKKLAAVEGSGLGLAITARLVKRMEGEIGYADNPGGGSIFWIELPQGDIAATDGPDEADPASLQTEVTRVAPARGLHVLVVDDSEINLDIASSFLRFLGHRVTCVGGGQEAVEAVVASAFDMVLMDVQMPVMDGLEATRRIRGLPGGKGGVPVVALTAQVFSEQLEACRLAGMSGHLSKPFTEAALRAVLAELVPGAASTQPDARAPEPEPAGEPLIDGEVFRTNTRLLKPSVVIGHLENIAASMASLRSALRDADRPPDIDAVVMAAHKLAGNLGLFGFARAAEAARRFERAAGADRSGIGVSAETLAAALVASMPEIEARLAAVRQHAVEHAGV